MIMRPFGTCSRVRAWRFVAAALLSAVVASTVGGANGATSSTVVAATVPSATFLSINPADSPVAGNCLSSTPGVTSFGSILPGTSAVTSSDCVVRFGSSNDTSSLRMYQDDSTGRAMRRSQLGSIGEVEQVLGTSGVIFAGMRQPDGTYIAVGRANAAVLVAKLLADGSLDPTFGTGGLSITEVDTGNDNGYGVARQADGKLVVVGSSVDPVNSDQEIFALRLNINGSPDNSFGTLGIAMFAQTTFNDLAQDVEVQADGKILIGGHTSPAGNLRMTVMRLLTNGTRDPAWAGGSDAVLGTEMGSAIGIAIQPDGMVVAAGRRWTGTTWDSIIARYSSTGVLDNPAFGTGGYTLVPVSVNEDYLDDLVVQPDGTIIAAGNNTEAAPDRDLVVMKFSAAGVLVPGFGAGGIALVDIDARVGFVGEGGIARYPDGRILVGGASISPAGQSLTVARLLTSGSLDGTFGVGGVITTKVGTGTNRTGSIILDADGTLTTVGTSGTDRLVMSQVHPGNEPEDFQAGVADWTPTATAMFGACLRRATNGAATNGTTWTADTVDADCADGNGDPWKPIARLSGDAGALVAVAPSGDADAEADLRFGFRTAGTQLPGKYYAQIGFEVLAPG